MGGIEWVVGGWYRVGGFYRVGAGGWYRVRVGRWYRVRVGRWYMVGVVISVDMQTYVDALVYLCDAISRILEQLKMLNYTPFIFNFVCCSILNSLNTSDLAYYIAYRNFLVSLSYEPKFGRSRRRVKTILPAEF